jgi:hypothetical protein
MMTFRFLPMTTTIVFHASKQRPHTAKHQSFVKPPSEKRAQSAKPGYISFDIERKVSFAKPPTELAQFTYGKYTIRSPAPSLKSNYAHVHDF